MGSRTSNLEAIADNLETDRAIAGTTHQYLSTNALQEIADIVRGENQ